MRVFLPAQELPLTPLLSVSYDLTFPFSLGLRYGEHGVCFALC